MTTAADVINVAKSHLGETSADNTCVSQGPATWLPEAGIDLPDITYSSDDVNATIGVDEGPKNTRRNVTGFAVLAIKGAAGYSWHDATEAQPGDFAIWAPDYFHVSLVEDVQGGSIRTIGAGGPTGQVNWQPRGGGYNPPAQFHGVVRPPYAVDVPAPVETPPVAPVPAAPATPTETTPATPVATDPVEAPVTTQPAAPVRQINQNDLTQLEGVIPAVNVDPNALGAIIENPVSRKRVYAAWNIYGLAIAALTAGTLAAVAAVIVGVAIGWPIWATVPVAFLAANAGIYTALSPSVSNLAAANTKATK